MAIWFLARISGEAFWSAIDAACRAAHTEGQKAPLDWSSRAIYTPRVAVQPPAPAPRAACRFMLAVPVVILYSSPFLLERAESARAMRLFGWWAFLKLTPATGYLVPATSELSKYRFSRPGLYPMLLAASTGWHWINYRSRKLSAFRNCQLLWSCGSPPIRGSLQWQWSGVCGSRCGVLAHYSQYHWRCLCLERRF